MKPESTGVMPPTDSADRTLLNVDRTRILSPQEEETTYLRSSQLMVARILWVIFAVAALGLHFISMPLHYHELTTINTGETRAYYFLTPPEKTALDEIGVSLNAYSIILDGSVLLMLGVFVGFALLIFLRKSDNWLALLISATLVGIGVTYNSSITTLPLIDPNWSVPVGLVRAAAFSGAVWCIYLFPNGRFKPRWLAIPALVWTVYVLIAPFFQGMHILALASTAVGLLLLLAVLAIGIVAQIQRYRVNFTTQQRLQTRWILFALITTVTGFGLFISVPLIFREAMANGLLRVLFVLLGVPFLVVIPALTIPVAMAVSIFRYRLWNIDVIISRALVGAALTLILGAVYILGVIGLQQIFQLLTGGLQSNIAIAGATALIVLIFEPLRRRIQRWVEVRLGIVMPRRTVLLSKTATPITTGQHSGRLTGTRLGQYEVGDLIGQGGMAEVYKGRHLTLNRLAAIKALSPQLALDDDFRRRFEREAQTIATLQQVNIVQVFDFGRLDDVYYMAMQLIEGHTLSEYLHTKPVLTLDEAIPLIEDMGCALDYAHAKGVIHRDVKPSNIMLQPLTVRGAQPGEPEPPKVRAILTDFGLAKLLSSGTANSVVGVMGTLSYIAPEQITSAEEVTPAVDMYALGVVTYQMLTGQLPFTGDNPGALLLAHLQKPAPDPRHILPNLPDGAAIAILTALSKDPDARFKTAEAFVNMLKAARVNPAQTG